MAKKLLLLSVLTLLPLTGASCPDLNGPVTEVKVSPVTKTLTFHDTKDNSIHLKGLTSKTSGGGELNIEELLIENQASSVIREQKELMVEYTAQLKQLGQDFQAYLGQLNQLASTLLPGGLTPIIRPASGPSLIDQAKQLLELKAQIDAISKKLPDTTDNH